jgi:hypothetical protein
VRIGKIEPGLDLVERDMVGERASVRDVPSRGQTSERLEVVYEMRLVKVAAGQSDFGPVNPLLMLDEPEGVLEPLDAAEQLWGETNLILKQLGEPLVADADAPDDVRNAPGLGHLQELSQCVLHGGMP